MESGNDHFEIKKFALAPALGGGKVDPLWVQSPPPQKNCSIIARKKKKIAKFIFFRGRSANDHVRIVPLHIQKFVGVRWCQKKLRGNRYENLKKLVVTPSSA